MWLNAFDKSVRRTPNLHRLFTSSLSFSVTSRRKFWGLCFFSEIALISGMITWRIFSLTNFCFFLYSGITAACISSSLPIQHFNFSLIYCLKTPLCSLLNLILIEVPVLWQMFVAFSWLVNFITWFLLYFFQNLI